MLKINEEKETAGINKNNNAQEKAVFFLKLRFLHNS